MTAGANYGRAHRPNLQLSRPTYLGIHERAPHPKRLPPLARVWVAHAPAEVVVGWEWQRWRNTTDRRVLDIAGPHVHHQLRLGGLGIARADPVATPPTRRRASCCFFIRYLDVPNPYLFEFGGNIGCSVEFGSH